MCWLNDAQYLADRCPLIYLIIAFARRMCVTYLPDYLCISTEATSLSHGCSVNNVNYH